MAWGESRNGTAHVLAPIYRHLVPGAALPDISPLAPFRTVIVVEAIATPPWESRVSAWLVRSGCLYVMTWGIQCESWHDAVDYANMEQFEFEEIPEGRFVMTTWHDDVPLSEAFWFCKHNAFHPAVELKNTLLLHIAAEPRRDAMLKAYAAA